MAEETNYPSLQGKRVSTTYGGVLHLPHSLTGTKNIVYDGKGTPTSLTIGGISQGADVSGNLTAGNITNSGNLSTTGSVSVTGNAVIGGDITLTGGGKINDVEVGAVGSSSTLIAPNNAEVGRLKIRDTASDYEIGFGNNLFTIAVKKTGSNNLFVKNNYAAADNLSPLWINKTTGEVNVASLNTGSISNNGNLINKGTVSVDGVATFNSNLTIIGSNTVGGDITMTGGGKINDIEVGAVGSTKTLVSPNNTEVGKLRVRQTSGDYEVLFGDDPTNLFSIIVKKGNGNNLYIKNNYADADIQSPLWIDKATGEVNIKNLNVTSVKTVPPPGVSVPPGQPANRNSNVIPVGMIGTFPSLIIPDGWFLCDGAFKSKTTFPELFAFLQYAYGGGADNFALPDYRELFMRGWGGNRGIDSDLNRAPGNRQEDEIRSHSHPLDKVLSWPRGSRAAVTEQNQEADPEDFNAYSTNTNSFGGSKTRPKNIAVVYCIKW